MPVYFSKRDVKKTTLARAHSRAITTVKLSPLCRHKGLVYRTVLETFTSYGSPIGSPRRESYDFLGFYFVFWYLLPSLLPALGI